MNKTNHISVTKKLKALPLTLLSYFLAIFITIFLFIPTFLIASIPEKYRSQKLFFWFLDKLYKSLLIGTFMKFDFIGEENLSDSPTIFIANHESALDIPILGKLMCNKPHFWFIYKRYMQIPIFRILSRQLGVSVDDESPEKLARALITGTRIIENSDIHTVIFPEGGRYADGKIHDFYSGFSFIAKKTGRPVIPIFLKNVGKVYPPKSFFIYPYPIKIIIGPAFYFTKEDSIESFTKNLYSWFEKLNLELN